MKKTIHHTRCACLFGVMVFVTGYVCAQLPKPVCLRACGTHRLVHGRCIQVGKNTLYYRTQGHGKPTIIFASGTGFSSDGWFESKIASKMATKNQVLSYDRLYTFNSCSNTNDYMPNTAKDVVNRLRSLLNTLNISPPYILVGHSFGGLYLLLFARYYPKEVAGLLLMDATSHDGPTPLSKKALATLKKQGNPQNPSPNSPLYNEQIGQLPSYLQLRAAPPLQRNMPLVVMYATKHCLSKVLMEGKLYCMTKEQEKNHVNQQLAIYNMSDNHALYEIQGGHMAFFETSQRQFVLKAIAQLLNMAKTRYKKLFIQHQKRGYHATDSPQ